jgi:ComF family protein
MALGLTLAAAARTALDLLLPPQCLTCDAPVDAPGRFCPECFRRIGFITEPCCAHCGAPFSHAGQGGPERLCPGCRSHPAPWGRARAAFRYDAQARLLMLRLKYHDRTDLAAALAPLLVRAGAMLLREAEVLVPVPLHRRRLIARRYNQAALLAQAVSRHSGVPTVVDALRRVRATASLGRFGAAARAELLSGAFALRQSRRGRIAERRVLLIDDVMTSGATCAACTDVLLESGAAAVDVLVAARVPDPRLH